MKKWWKRVWGDMTRRVDDLLDELQGARTPVPVPVRVPVRRPTSPEPPQP